MPHPHDLEVNRFDTLVEALLDLQQRGYTHNFKITEDGAKCIETGDVFQSNQMMITEFHRFEGESSPGDMSVVYVVDCDNGTKGSIVDAFGTYANIEIADFLKTIRWAGQPSKENTNLVN